MRLHKTTPSMNHVEPEKTASATAASEVAASPVTEQVADSDANRPAYRCADCGVPCTVVPKQPIRCKECGYRIIYKERAKIVVSVVAR